MHVLNTAPTFELIKIDKKKYLVTLLKSHTRNMTFDSVTENEDLRNKNKTLQKRKVKKTKNTENKFRRELNILKKNIEILKK